MVRISQTRIRSINRVSPFLTGKLVAFGIPLQDAWDKLQKIWFPQNPSDGTTILPAVVWAVTRFNAEGKEKVRRDLEKETLYRQHMWSWKDWSGKEYEEVVDVPYQRYPRDFIAPPGIELTVTGGKIVSPVFHIDTQQDEIVHAVNIFLEIFRSCDILDEDLEEIMALSGRRVNWRILPKWPIPWEKLEQEMLPILEKQKPQVRTMFKERFETVQQYGPDFLVLGEGGFSWYVVFGFEEKNLFLCESLWSGNAVYIFEENWEELSKKTKAEILSKNLQKDRIPHYKDWQKKIHQLLSKKK